MRMSVSFLAAAAVLALSGAAYAGPAEDYIKANKCSKLSLIHI